MIRAGFTFEHPTSKTHVLVLESDADNGGLGFLIELTRFTTTGPDLAEHLHESWTERFEVLEGTARYRIAGREDTARAGESFVVLPGQLHAHPWNAVEGRLVIRQRTNFNGRNPQAVQDILGILATRAGMLRDGTEPTSSLGQTLQSAVTLRTVLRHGNYMAMPSVRAQRLIAATLGALGEALGYRAIHEKYTT